MMLLSKIQLLEETATATCTGSGTYVYSKRVPAGEVWRVRAICVNELENNFEGGYIGVYNGTTYRVIKEDFLPTDYEGAIQLMPAITLTGDIYVKQGDMIFAYVNGETSDATLTLEVYGEILKEE